MSVRCFSVAIVLLNAAWDVEMSLHTLIIIMMALRFFFVNLFMLFVHLHKSRAFFTIAINMLNL